ncbi:cysteinyl-tRNA synthetase [Thoreauomyces humboldtii]|nr:cysteinyl-tRNA synthetase [Thoreauomyces humboldtii]
MEGGVPPPRKGSLPQGQLSSRSSTSGRFLDDLLNEYNYPSAAHSPQLSRSPSTTLDTTDRASATDLTTTGSGQLRSEGDGAKGDLPPLPVGIRVRSDSMRYPGTPPPTSPLPRAPVGLHPADPNLNPTSPTEVHSAHPRVPAVLVHQSPHSHLQRGRTGEARDAGTYRDESQTLGPASETRYQPLQFARDFEDYAIPRGSSLRLQTGVRSTEELHSASHQQAEDTVEHDMRPSLQDDGLARFRSGSFSSTPTIASRGPASASSTAGSVYSGKDSESPPKSGRTFLSASSPNGIYPQPPKVQPHEQSSLTAEKWNTDGREKKKGFISHLFGRKKEKVKDQDHVQDSTSSQVSRANPIDIGGSPTVDARLILYPQMMPPTSKKKGKSREEKAPKNPELDLSDFSMDPSYVPMDVVSLSSPLSPHSHKHNNGGSASIGYGQNPGNHAPQLGPPSASFGSSGQGPQVYLSPATSAWKPPESWGTKFGPGDSPVGPMGDCINQLASDRLAPKAASLLGVAPIPVKSQDVRYEDITMPDMRGETDTIRSGYDSLSEDRLGALRLFRRDGTFATISCRESTTAGELLTTMAKKSLIADYSKFSIHIIRKGFERILSRTERPLMLQRRLFEQIGYRPTDKIELLGREDNSYLCRFIFKEVSIGNDVPADFWRSANFSTSTVSLSRMNLTAVPLTCFRFANDIVSLDLSLNPNVQEIPNDLAQTLESTRLVNMSRNELSRVPKSLEFIHTLTEIDLSHNRIATLAGTGLENLRGLTKLRLTGNLIDHIPSEIPLGCQKLEVLDLSNNRFQSFPMEVCRHLGKSLRSLDLSFCRIKEQIPPEIGDLKNLAVLRMAGNRAYGGLPWQMGDLPELVELDLRGNSFGNIGGAEAMVMEVLSRCVKLEAILLDANRIRWIGRWADRTTDSGSSSPARRMEEEDYYSSDSEDAGTTNARTLEYANVKRLSLASQFDPSHTRSMIFRLSNTSGSLAELDLGYSGMEYLPHRFFQRLPGLLKLNLSGNRLRDLPDFGSSASGEPGKVGLRELYISNNFLEYLPDDIGELERLVILEVKGNNLRELPADIWRCRSLRILNISSNRLETFPTPYPEDGPAVSVVGGTAATFNRSGGFSFGNSFDRAGGLPSRSRSRNRPHDDGNQNEAPQQQQQQQQQQQLNLPPLSHALEHLYLSDNHLGDDIYMALYHLPNLQTLHASFNEFTDITPWVVAIPLPIPMAPWFLKLQELHLSGNLISTLPGEIERIRTLKTLFLNGNKMSTIPGEVGKLKSLVALDLGSQVGGRGEGTGLRYNVSNWPYDWNWNWNLDLKYLNLSGNKRLEIKPSAAQSNFLGGAEPVAPSTGPSNAAGHKVGARGGAIQAPATSGALVGNPSQRRRDLTDFNALTSLRLLGLMDVTCLIVPPDESTERRIRTTGSDVPMVGVRGGVVRYGVADVLSRPLPRELVPSPFSASLPEVQHTLSKESDPDTFEVWDLVIPKFRGRDNEALFAVFDGKGTSGGAKMAKYLNEWFGWFLANELERVERVDTANPEQTRDRPSDGVEIRTAESQANFSRSGSATGPLKQQATARDKRPPLPVDPAERAPGTHLLDAQAISTALRRTFIAVNRELGSMGDELDEGLAGPQHSQQQRNSSEPRRKDSPASGVSTVRNKRGGIPPGSAPTRPLYGASALVVFLYGSAPAAKRGATKCTMYIANVGDGMAVMSKAGGTAQVMSNHHVLDLVGMSRAEAALQQTKAEGKSRPTLDDSSVDHLLVNGSTPWPRSEVERVQSAGGAFCKSGLVDGEAPLTRGFGYFPHLGAVNADPWIETVELEVGDDSEESARILDPRLRQPAPPADSSGNDDLPESPSGTALNGGDEFVVLASSAVWNAVRCGGAYEDGAQIVVDIARSALTPSGAGAGGAGSSNMTGMQGSSVNPQSSSGGGGGMTKSASNLASVQTQGNKSTGGWGTAAMKVRDVALSLSGGQVGGGYLVMVLGLRDLAKKSTWWNAVGARRGSAESSIESLTVDERTRKNLLVGSEGALVKGLRKKGTDEAFDMVGVLSCLSASSGLIILLQLTKEIAPPVGRLALVFTDIKNSTSIWENNPIAMRTALRLHHSVMRKLLRQTGGYEVKTEGDAFMVSFQNVSNAVEWCLTVQGELLNIDWPTEILGTVDGLDIWWQKAGASEFVTGAGLEDGDSNGAGSDVEVEMTDDDGASGGRRKGAGGATPPTSRKKRELIFKGLSVRMGIHFGNPLCEVDPITSRMDYYGPMVNRCARVTGASQGGQILVSSDSMKELKRTLGWWTEDTVEGAIVDGVKSGEDLTDNIGLGTHGPPSSGLHPHSAQTNSLTEETARLKRLGVVAWCIGEVKLKGLENPEVIYAIYRRDLYTRHRFYALEQSGGLNLLTQPARKPDEVPARDALVAIDRGTVQNLAALCIRLEWFAARSGDDWRAVGEDRSMGVIAGGGGSVGMPPEDGGEWAVEGVEEGDRPALIRALESVVTRVENAISILHLTDTSFSRALQSLGAAIETDPTYILRAIQMYAEKVEERARRKAKDKAAKTLRKELRNSRRAKHREQRGKDEGGGGGGSSSFAPNGNSTLDASTNGTSSRSRRERLPSGGTSASRDVTTGSASRSSSSRHRPRDNYRSAERSTAEGRSDRPERRDDGTEREQRDRAASRAPPERSPASPGSSVR